MDRSISHYPPPTGLNHPPVKNVHLILFASVLDPGLWLFLLVLAFSFCLKGFSSLCFLSMKEFTCRDGAAVGSVWIGADGALLLPPHRALPPAAPGLCPCSAPRSLEQGTSSPPTLDFGAKSLLATSHWVWPTRAPWDQLLH